MKREGGSLLFAVVSACLTIIWWEMEMEKEKEKEKDKDKDKEKENENERMCLIPHTFSRSTTKRR